MNADVTRAKRHCINPDVIPGKHLFANSCTWEKSTAAATHLAPRGPNKTWVLSTSYLRTAPRLLQSAFLGPRAQIKGTRHGVCAQSSFWPFLGCRSKPMYTGLHLRVMMPNDWWHGDSRDRSVLAAEAGLTLIYQTCSTKSRKIRFQR